MKKLVLLAGACVGLAALPDRSSAIEINTYPGWDGSVTAYYNWSAQTFVTPDGARQLHSWKFGFQPRDNGGNLQFSIFRWANNAPQGDALFNTAIPWPEKKGPNDKDVNILVNNIDLDLISNARYGVVIDMGFTFVPGENIESVHFSYDQDHYSDGQAFWAYKETNLRSLGGGELTEWTTLPTADHQFHAVFRGGAGPAVPEPGSWLVSAALGLVPLSLQAFRRTRR